MAEQSAQGGAASGDPHGFKLSSTRRAKGLTLRGAIRIVPQLLTERFGPPSGATGDGKVSGTYVFEDGHGNTVAIYDWKSTTLHDSQPAANLPAAHAFWTSHEPAEFTLATAGRVDLIEFARWVGAKSIAVERALQWMDL